MANKEVRASAISVGDTVRVNGAVEVVVAKVRVGYPSRDLFLLESGASVSFTESQLIERSGSGRTVDKYEGPSWICGMPEQVPVSQLEPGDMVLGSKLKIVRTVLQTASEDSVVLFGEGEYLTADSRTRLRVIVRGLAVEAWTGPTEYNGTIEMIPAGSLRVGDVVMGGRSFVNVTGVERRALGAVSLSFDDSTQIDSERDVMFIQLIERTTPQPEPTTTVEPETVAFGECEKCGRRRLEGQKFCTGCGSPHSNISTTGFQR